MADSTTWYMCMGPKGNDVIYVECTYYVTWYTNSFIGNLVDKNKITADVDRHQIDR